MVKGIVTYTIVSNMACHISPFYLLKKMIYHFKKINKPMDGILIKFNVLTSFSTNKIYLQIFTIIEPT